MRGTARILIGSLCLATLAACASKSDDGTRPITLRGDGQTITVHAEIADDDSERERGLMERTGLSESAGMLFIMDDETVLKFWMKNTLIPLDILFFDADHRFVSAATMFPCKADPCPVTASAAPARFALEVPAGSAAKWKVGEGWILRGE
jgi:uncharacterized protein